MVDPIGDKNWLALLVGDRAAQVMRRITVECLHTAHEQAQWRWRMAEWTDARTYGQDRYVAFCHYFAQEVQRLLPGAEVRRPDEVFGSPFLVIYRGTLFYPWRYGDTTKDPVNGATIDNDKWILQELTRKAPDGQGQLDYPNLPAVSLSRVVMIPWAGSRDEGLVAAYLGRPFASDDGKHVCYDEDLLEQLDVTVGRTLYALPEDRHEIPEGQLLPRLTPPPEATLTLRPEELPEPDDEDLAVPVDEDGPTVDAQREDEGDPETGERS